MMMALRAALVLAALGFTAGPASAEETDEEAVVAAIHALESFFGRYDPRSYSAPHTPAPPQAIAELAIASPYERVRKVGLNVLRESCPSIPKSTAYPTCVKKIEGDAGRQGDVGTAVQRIALGSKDPDQTREAIETLMATVSHAGSLGGGDRRSYDAIQSFPWLYYRLLKQDPQDSTMIRARMALILQQASFDSNLKFRADEASTRIRCWMERGDTSACISKWWNTLVP